MISDGNAGHQKEIKKNFCRDKLKTLIIKLVEESKKEEDESRDDFLFKWEHTIMIIIILFLFFHNI